MKTADQWFAEYGESHKDPTNKTIHWVCVPAIVFSLVGLLWSLPVPTAFAEYSPYANWGVIFIIFAMAYYMMLSFPLALGMIIVSAGVIAGLRVLSALDTPLWQICLGIFALAWIGQFIGHRIEGKKPSFFKDIQFLMIGPVWLLGFIYRKLGIPY